MLKKISVAIISALFLLVSVFVPTAQAYTWYNQSPSEWFSKVHDTSNPSEIFGERYTFAQVDWVIMSVLSWPTAKILGSPIVQCLGSGDVAACFSNASSSIVPVPVGNAVKPETKSFTALLLEDRPLSGITYVKDVLRKYSLIPEANAQVGFGFETALSPVLSMWRASRNIAYSLLALVVVVLSFMIMFRVKISPQVVIGIQSALPKIAIAAVLITFSYAIAGFLVDLMYVAIGVVSLLLKEFFPFDVSSSTLFNWLTKGQPFGADVQLGAIGLFALYIFLFLLVLAVTLFMMVGLIGASLATVVAAVALIGANVGSAVIGFVALLVLAVIAIVIIWMTIKTLWTLVKAFASVLLLTIFAPFQLLLGAVSPSFGFGQWIKSMVSNLSVFVVVGALFMLSFIFLIQGFVTVGSEFLGGTAVDNFFNILFGTQAVDIISGQASASWPPLLGIGNSSGVALLMIMASFVIFTIIPKSSDIIKAMIEGKPFAYGSAIGEIMAPYRYAMGTPAGKDIQQRLGAESASNVLNKVAGVLPEGKYKRGLRNAATESYRRTV